MPRINEPLFGGVWTAQDPAQLQPGQLSDARNCYWVQGSPALQRARGRASFGAVSATGVDVVGVRDIQFDNGDHTLIALASATLASAAVGDTGVFGVLTSGLAGVGSQLEAVQYRNRFFLLNGFGSAASAIDSNSVVYLSATAAGTPATVRQHGMLPVNSTPNVTTAAGTFSQTVTGYYEYWTTEVAKFTQDGASAQIESGFVGQASTVFVSSTGQVPVIQQPVIKNSITTNWRIYRSPVKGSASAIEFPTGFMIAEVGTATASVSDTQTTTATSAVLPANVNVAPNLHSDCGASASALEAADGVYAPLAVGSVFSVASQGVYGFNFGGFSGSVKGIAVEVKAYVSSGSAPAPLSVTIGTGRNPSGEYTYFGGSDPSTFWGEFSGLGQGPQPQTKSQLVSAVASGSANVLTYGSSTDRWTPSDKLAFTDTDFGTNFMVVIAASKPSTTISVDYVKVTVSYSATVDGTVPFPTVVYTFGDITSQVAKNGMPPSASTGDIFQDALVCNDVGNPALVRYSFPGEPEAFPASYFLDFQTRENDQVRLIRVVNGHLVVGLDSSTWRVNYLPNERDAQFDRGVAIEAITRSYGIVNPMCACTFSPGGGQELLAFVSDQGIHATDGYNFDTYTNGLDWRGTIMSLTSTSTPIALVNDRERQMLLFYFRNDSYGSETYLCLPLCYGEPHWGFGGQPATFGRGRPKVGGLVHMRNFDAGSGTFAALKSATVVPRSTGTYDVFLGYGGTATAAGAGTVYRETGTTLPTQDQTMRYVTRRIYPADLSTESELDEVYGYTGSYTGGPVVTYSVEGSKTNDSGPAQLGSKSITLAGQKLHKTNFRVMSEGFRVTAQVTASAFAAEHLVLGFTPYGLEDSGR